MESTDIPMQFQSDHSYAERAAESARILQKYPSRKPIVVEAASGADVPPIDKHKYLVPTDITCGQFLYIIRKRIQLEAERALFLYTEGNLLPPSSMLIGTLYTNLRNQDGFLYLCYTTENSFG